MTRPGYKMTEIGEIPEEWGVLAFEESFNKQKSKQSKIPASKFKNKGKFPIIDQGRDLISGYTDNDELLYNGNLPLIIFGDHTLCVKYVDFQFAVGADGTKLLIPNNQRFSPKFLFYTILGKNRKSEGYKRHFSKLRKQFFQCPGINEQQKIAEILSSADQVIQKVNEEITLTEKLKKGLMQTLLAKGIGHTKFKITEIGEIPEEWSIKSISECSIPVNGIDPFIFARTYFKYIDVSGISSEKLAIVETKEIQGVAAPSRARKEVKENDVIFATVRPYLKRVAIVPKYLDGNVCSTAFCVVRASKKEILPRFLYYYMTSDKFVSKISGLQTGSTYPAVSDSQVISERIAIPSLYEQQQITEILTTVDDKLEILRNKKTHLEKLKKGLMGDLLTGKVRVKINTSIGEN